MQSAPAPALLLLPLPLPLVLPLLLVYPTLLAHHENKVCECWRVDCAPRAGPHDAADLRHHTTGIHVALKHLGVTCGLAVEEQHRSRCKQSGAMVLVGFS
jgi:hypothetical protein